MNAKASIAFLKEAAAYFSRQPTDGEDSKHWANVLNSENCIHAAEVIASQASRIAELESAIDDFRPLAQVAFLWQTSGARPGEVERYRDSYQRLLSARAATGEAP